MNFLADMQKVQTKQPELSSVQEVLGIVKWRKLFLVVVMSPEAYWSFCWMSATFNYSDRLASHASAAAALGSDLVQHHLSLFYGLISRLIVSLGRLLLFSADTECVWAGESEWVCVCVWTATSTFWLLPSDWVQGSLVVMGRRCTAALRLDNLLFMFVCPCFMNLLMFTALISSLG